jgi:Response regulator containing CheY-like receiver domain and AraC-type DNA-binding domain
MAKAIIVEDEVITRNGLMKHIPWGELGIEMVEAAENAEEALKICEEYQPDLIVSDIKMRGMNGVTMSRELRKKYPECQLIYISGYSDKEYLKAAIELGAVNYVEKPISPQELIASIRKAADSIRKLQENKEVKYYYEDHFANLKSKLLHSLIMSDDSDENLAKNIANSGLFSADKKSMRICLLHVSNRITNFSKLKSELEPRLTQICNRYHTGFYLSMLDAMNIVLLLSCSDRELEKNSPFLKEIEKYLTGISSQTTKIYLSIGNKCNEPVQLSVSYQSALEALKCLSFQEYGCCSYSDEPFSDRHYGIEEAVLDRFQQAISSSNIDEIISILEDIRTKLKKERAVLNHSVRNIYYKLDNIIWRYESRVSSLKQEEGQSSDENSIEIDCAMTLSELTEYIIKHAREAIHKNQNEVKNSSAVCQTLELIHKDYMNPELSVNSLAEGVFLTPTYLSALFKKETGVTIGQYLTNYRIERAKQLLRDKRYKLYRISSLVGYSDANYFARIFKRQVGIIPSEYREKYLK